MLEGDAIRIANLELAISERRQMYRMMEKDMNEKNSTCLENIETLKVWIYLLYHSHKRGQAPIFQKYHMQNYSFCHTTRNYHSFSRST